MKLSLDFEDDFYQFSLYGLQTSLLDEIKCMYKWNKFTHLKFERVEDLVLDIDHESFHFSVYHHAYEMWEEDLFMIKNKSQPKTVAAQAGLLFENTEVEQWLLPKAKQFDFLLKVNPEVVESVLNTLSLKSENWVLEFVPIDVKSKKDKKKFIF